MRSCWITQKSYHNMPQMFGNISYKPISVLLYAARHFCVQCLTSRRILNSIKTSKNHSLPDYLPFLNNLNSSTKLHCIMNVWHYSVKCSLLFLISHNSLSPRFVLLTTALQPYSEVYTLILSTVLSTAEPRLQQNKQHQLNYLLSCHTVNFINM